MFKCDHKNLSFSFYELRDLDNDHIPKYNEFCLLLLKDGRFTAGRGDLEKNTKGESPTGTFLRGQFDSIPAEEVS